MKPKKINRFDINERLIKKILDKFFPNIEIILQNWQEVFDNPDYSQPKTILKNIERDIETTIKPVNDKKLILLVKFVRRFLLKNSFFKNEIVNIPTLMAKLAKNEAKKDSRYSLLLELISEADKHFPFSPLLVAFRHGDFRQTFPVNCSPMPYLVEVEKTKGEKRAFYAYEAMRHICEHIYQPYILTIWQLSYLRAGKLPPANDSYGNMVKNSLQNLPQKFHSLIEPTASIMRNAPSHNPLDWIYETDSIILKDKEKKLIISVDELIEKIKSMLQISSSTISFVGQVYLFRTFNQIGILDKLFELMPDFISNDETKIKFAETELNEFIIEQLKMRGIEVNQNQLNS